VTRQIKKRQKSLSFPKVTGNKNHPLQQIFTDMEVLFESEDVLVLSKPSGVLMHPVKSTPNKGRASVTLADALMKVYGEDGLSQISEFPGIVHRLDKGTSGILFIAKSDLAHALLASLFFKRKVQKRYQALVPSCPVDEKGEEVDCGTIDAKVDGLPAQSSWRVLEKFPGSGKSTSASLIEVSPMQGRKHQVRAHLSVLGCPLLLDPIYKASSKSRAGVNERNSVHNYIDQLAKAWDDDRFFLHSSSYMVPEFVLKPLERSENAELCTESHLFEAARPAWFEEVLSTLRKN